MTISDNVKSWISLLTNIGVLVGLFLLVIELKQNSQQLELQLQFQANQKMFENNRDLAGENIAVIFAKAITTPEELTFEEGLAASSHIINWLNIWEDKFFIYKAGLISEQEWKRDLEASLGWILGSSFAKKVWLSTSSEFEPEFSEYVDSQLVDISDNETYQWWLGIKSNFPN